MRLEPLGDGLIARTAASKAPRIAAKAQLGVLGDPWAPVELLDQPKVLTLTGDGFGYRKMVELLVGTERRSYVLPALARPAPDETRRPMRLWAAALARGQGKTEGFHTRTLDLPPEAMTYLARPEGEDLLRKRARTQLRTTGDAAGKALRPALIVLVQKGPKDAAWSKPSNDILVRPGLLRFEAGVDQAFFPALWRGLALDETAAQRTWVQTLAGLARDTLAWAAGAAPRD